MSRDYEKAAELFIHHFPKLNYTSRYKDAKQFAEVVTNNKAAMNDVVWSDVEEFLKSFLGGDWLDFRLELYSYYRWETSHSVETFLKNIISYEDKTVLEDFL